jgi:arachidonate 15-lipoxygenase
MACLPQSDPAPGLRRQKLTEQQTLYKYNQTKLPGLPMLDKVPPADESFGKSRWVKDVVSLGLRIRANQGLQDFETLGQFRRVMCYFFLSLVIADPKRNKDLKRLFEMFLPLIRFIIGVVNRFRARGKALPDNPQQIVDKVRVEQLVKNIKPIPRNKLISGDHKTTSREAKTDPDTQGNQSFDDYRPRLQPFNDLCQIIYLPEISQYFQYDRSFAAQRVAGANPIVIQRVEQLPANFPVTDNHYQDVMGDTDSLARAGSQGRLYLADYAVLENMPEGTFPKGVKKYRYAPLALFAVPAGDGANRSLVPIAIQCGQDSSRHPIFTPPPAGTPQVGQWDWLIAKTIVQIADGNYHELISHLGGTHLFLEAFAISTPRQLAPNHPLYILLTPHFEGTLFINDSALKGLVNDEGTVDRVLFSSIGASKALSAKAAKGYPYSFNDSMLPKTLKARGVDDPSLLPDYPYRDDALLIWEAIHTWVNDYLSLYYRSDADVQADWELQAWFQELIADNSGQMSIQDGSFGEIGADGKPGLYTRAYLIEAITLIIFTASAQHAAVNFAQADFLTYAPNMPLAGYCEAPSAPGNSAEDYFKLLPDLTQSEAQLNMTYVLGSVYYTKLGHYGEDLDRDYFSDAGVKPHLVKFQQRLQKIELIIEARNATRPTYYDTLLPNKIPQSINI